MEYKHQIDDADYSKLLNKVYLIEAVMFSLSTCPFAKDISNGQAEGTSWLCFDMAHEVSKLVRGMEEVKVPDPEPEPPEPDM